MQEHRIGMSEPVRLFHPPESVVRRRNVSGMAAYHALCAEAEPITRASGRAWRARSCSWQNAVHQGLDESNAPFFKWFDDGELNVSYNCLDRHVERRPGARSRSFSRPTTARSRRSPTGELLTRICQFANALKARGIKKGDRVIIYMPMSIEGVVAMQACARIGATHSVVFGGFSAKSVQERITTPAPWWSSPPTARCAAARRCR